MQEQSHERELSAQSEVSTTASGLELGRDIYAKYGAAPGLISAAMDFGLGRRATLFGMQRVPLLSFIQQRWSSSNILPSGWPAHDYVWALGSAYPRRRNVLSQVSMIPPALMSRHPEGTQVSSSGRTVFGIDRETVADQVHGPSLQTLASPVVGKSARSGVSGPEPVHSISAHGSTLPADSGSDNPRAGVSRQQISAPEAPQERGASVVERHSAEITSRASSPSGNASNEETASKSDIGPQLSIDQTTSSSEGYAKQVVGREGASANEPGVRSTTVPGNEGSSSLFSGRGVVSASGSGLLASPRSTPELLPQAFSHRATVSRVKAETLQAPVRIVPTPEKSPLNKDGQDSGVMKLSQETPTVTGNLPSDAVQQLSSAPIVRPTADSGSRPAAQVFQRSRQEPVFERMQRPILARSRTAENAQVADRIAEPQTVLAGSSWVPRVQFEKSTNTENTRSSSADNAFITVPSISPHHSPDNPEVPHAARTMAEQHDSSVHPVRQPVSRNSDNVTGDKLTHYVKATKVYTDAISTHLSRQGAGASDTSTSDTGSQMTMESRIVQVERPILLRSVLSPVLSSDARSGGEFKVSGGQTSSENQPNASAKVQHVERVSQEVVHLAGTSTESSDEHSVAHVSSAGIALIPTAPDSNQHRSTPVHRQRLGYEEPFNSSEPHHSSRQPAIEAATKTSLLTVNRSARPSIAHLGWQSAGRIYRAKEEVQQRVVSAREFAQRATGSPGAAGTGESGNMALATLPDTTARAQQIAGADLNQLVNRVYELLVRRLASERQRRGM